jgi:hypothetical protein
MDNIGLFSRSVLFRGGKEAVFEGAIAADICQQDRFMLNGVEMSIKLWPSKAKFSLVTPADEKVYAIMLTDAYLSVCKVTPFPAIVMGIETALQEKAALYPYTRTDMRSFNISKDQFDFHLEDIYQQQVPNEVIIGMVQASAFNGSYKLNPYDFKHFDISSLALYVDDESVPAKPLKLDFSSGDYISAYNSLFENTSEFALNIDRGDYDSGYTLFRFRVTPEQASAGPPGKGNVKLHGIFKKALPANTTLIIIGKFNSVICIDKERVVTV